MTHGYHETLVATDARTMRTDRAAPPAPREPPAQHVTTCPVCELECFERPRYFCGQLLTDRDLGAEQRYHIEKQKLHNRYLHGWGVVCGLRVLCHPKCKPGWVVVEPGYAIDCCGNDLVVCDSIDFNVVKAIEECRRRTQPHDCAPPPEPCEEVTEYCLVARFKETPQRAVTALIRAEACTCRQPSGGCNCGGTKAVTRGRECACGNGNGHGGGSTTAGAVSTTQRCEPSRVLEGVELCVFEREPREPKKSELAERLKACLTDVMGVFSTPPDPKLFTTNFDAGYEAYRTWYCRVRDKIVELYRKGPNVRCAIADDCAKLTFPAKDLQNRLSTMTAMGPAFQDLVRLVYRFLLDCWCDAFLIRCPQCEGEVGVVLACLEVKDGEIHHICNTSRRHVVSFPTLGYWLGPIIALLAGRLSEGRAGTFSDLIEYFCCESPFLERIQLPQSETWEEALDHLTRGLARYQGLLGTALGVAKHAGFRGPTLDAVLEPATIEEVNGLTADQAEARLTERGYKVAGVRAHDTHEELYDLRNLRRMTMTPPPGSAVELCTGPDGKVAYVCRATGVEGDLGQRVAALEAKLAELEKRQSRRKGRA